MGRNLQHGGSGGIRRPVTVGSEDPVTVEYHTCGGGLVILNPRLTDNLNAVIEPVSRDIVGWRVSS